MFKRLLALGLFAAIALPLMAQDYPKFEAGGYYSYVRANITAKNEGFTPDAASSTVSASQSFNLQGGGGNFVYNPFHSLGIVADFAGYDVTGLPKGTGASVTLFTYMFGPRYTYRGNERFQPFAHALFGGAHVSGSGSTGFVSGSGTSDAFAMAIGGGLDIKLTNHVALRAFEGDYLLTRFDTTIKANGSTEAANQNNFRLAAGVQFRF